MSSRFIFPPVATADWTAAIEQDLKGADFQKKLVWRLDEGLSVQPFNRRDDIAMLPVAPPPGAAPFERGVGRPWVAVAAGEWPADAIRADALHDAGATATQELAFAFADAVDRLDRASAAGRSPGDAAHDLAFVFAVGSTYFVEIAKLRAARRVWARIQDAFGVTPPHALRLHVRTARINKSSADPYTNMLRCTTEAMSAAIGGADTISVEATGFDPHLATNVLRILDEEAQLTKVEDPGAGAYVIEHLTDALARSAWTLFQEIERQGGYSKAVESGMLRDALAASRQTRAAAVATRKRTLVGVNNYPDTAATVTVPPTLAGDTEAERLAAPFEALRARTARHIAAGGRHPHVHLITRGPVAMRTARANFCLNFFGCAGFRVTQGDHLDPAADVQVLCSADTEYITLAQAVVPESRVPIIVAGHPVDHLDALKAAGVTDFVYLGIDAVKTLGQWQDRLGLRA